MRGRGIPRVADRNMQLVCSYETLLRVLKLPPELVADRRDLSRARRETRILNRMNHTRGRKEQHHHDEHGNDGPGEFHLVAAVNLRGLTVVILGTLAEFRDGINQQAENHQKDSATDDRWSQREWTRGRICSASRDRIPHLRKRLPPLPAREWIRTLALHQFGNAAPQLNLRDFAVVHFLKFQTSRGTGILLLPLAARSCWVPDASGPDGKDPTPIP